MSYLGRRIYALFRDYHSLHVGSFLEHWSSPTWRRPMFKASLFNHRVSSRIQYPAGTYRPSQVAGNRLYGCEHRPSISLGLRRRFRSRLSGIFKEFTALQACQRQYRQWLGRPYSAVWYSTPRACWAQGLHTGCHAVASLCPWRTS